jgi:hypothetical protein
LKAEEVLAVILAHKMKKSIGDISFSKSLKDLVEGKSTLQNEIIGDLQKEFGSDSVPEKSEELPLKEVAAYLTVGHSGELGKFTNSLISKLIANKMPAGFGMKNIKTYLTNEFGLPSKRIDGVLLHRFFFFFSLLTNTTIIITNHHTQLTHIHYDIQIEIILIVSCITNYNYRLVCSSNLQIVSLLPKKLKSG